MTWLTWRQFRTQATVTAAALVAVAAVLTVTGRTLAQLYAASGISGCTTGCGSLKQSFLDHARNGATGEVLNLATGLVFVVPAVIGVFWGAPLVARELETGTHRLVWNQSVTRRRWLATKLVGVGLAGVATAGLLSLMVSWWAARIDTVGMHRITPDVFGARGIVPVGYAAFAFTLGVTAGAVVRRTVPAMAITLVVVAAAQIAMPLWVRPHLVAPVSVSRPLSTDKVMELSMNRDGGAMTVVAQPDQPGAWVLSNRTVTSTGQVFTGPANRVACNRDTSPKACMDWLGTLHLRQSLSYQPASRFWALQWRETAVFLVLSALLAAICMWWVRRRLA
jgi:ABC-2 family transporter protein